MSGARSKVRLAAAVLVIGISISQFPVLSATAGSNPKAGAKCLKIGKKLIFKQTTYMCTTAGRRLVWKIVTRPSTPLPPIPGSTETPIGNAGILFSALKELGSFSVYSSRSTHEHATRNLIDPLFDRNAFNVVGGGQQWVLDRFGREISPDLQIFSVFGTSEDFVRSALREIGGTDSWVETEIAQLKSIFRPSSDSRDFWAIPARPINGDRTKRVFIYKFTPSFIFRPDMNELGAHEMFHLVQESIVKTPGSLPCWVVEGQASLVGTTYASQGKSQTETLNIVRAFGPAHSAGADLNQIESPEGWRGGHGSCNDVGEYQQGRIAIALLMQSFGPENMFRFLSAMSGQPGDGVSWKRVFSETYGTSVESFYLKASDYLKWFFKNYFNQTL